MLIAEEFYAWKDGQVHVIAVEDYGVHSATMEPFHHCPVMDARYEDEPVRFGYIDHNGWHAGYQKDLPKEFRTQLLLLGVL